MDIKIFNKLVRDKIPEKIASNNEYSYSFNLDDEKYSALLLEKLIEESEEVITADSKQKITEELGDLLEVMHAVAKINDIDFSDVEKARISKMEKLGGFDKKVYLVNTCDQEYFDKNKGCITCINGCCRVPSKEKVGYEDDGKIVGHNCIGYKSAYTKKPL